MRLLIVEDEEVIAQNLKNLLELKGHAVDWLETAEKAFSRLSLYRKDYDLALVDLMLPGMSGADLTKKMRTEGIMIPVIIVTGESATEHKVALLNSGADDYVVKPFSTEELIARINSVLRRPTTTQPVVYTIGDITVDTATRRLQVGEKDIPLTLKEYSLLECFLRKPNTVLTREDLYNQVWDFNSVTWSNVLDVHIKNLRKKFEAAGHPARFQTVRGVGYRLVD